jgi:hypothetical protein
MARTTCKTVSHARRRNTTTLRVNHLAVASRTIRPPERCLTAREMIDAWRTRLGTALSPPGRRSTKGLSIAKPCYPNALRPGALAPLMPLHFRFVRRDSPLSSREQ